MDDKKNLQPKKTDETDLTVSEDTIVVIVGMAVDSVEGFAGMSGTITDEIAEVFGKKSQAKGLKIDMHEDTVDVNLSICVKYGCRIPDVAWKIQEKVRNDITQMTEYKVSSVNIYVQSIDFSK